MKLKAIALQRAILSGSIASLLVASSNVLATSEDAATLDVQATLSPSITIECNTALNFGKLIVPTGTRTNGSTDIMMEPGSGGLNEGGSSNEVTFGGTSSAGECELTGGPDGVEHTIKLLDPEGNELGTDGTGTSFGLGSSAGDAATTPASLEVIPKLATTTIAFNDGGTNTFNIGGKITIPDDLNPDNYGDYQKTIDVKVTTSP